MNEESINRASNKAKEQSPNLFYKHRNIATCISDGINIFTNNIFKYFQQTFIPIVLFALMLTGLLYRFVQLDSLIIANLKIDLRFIGYIIILSFFLFSIISYSDTIKYLFVKYTCVKNISPKFKLVHVCALKNFYKILCVRLFILFIISILCIGIYYINTIERMDLIIRIILVAFLSLLCLFLFIPTNLINSSLIYGNGHAFGNIIGGYIKGVVSFGKLFAIFFLLLLFKIVFGGLILTPMVSYSLIYRASIVSCLNGDIVELETNFIITYMFICFISIVSIVYLFSVLNMTYIFLYGSIVADKKEIE